MTTSLPSDLPSSDTCLAPDGTHLAFHREGSGPPLVCLPGGPMTASAYLGDLGGLAAHRTLVRLDLRGTGASAKPVDKASYRVDRQVADVEALRERLAEEDPAAERIDLLAHSAAGDLALHYAAHHPQRVRSLVLVTARARAAGIDFPVEQRREALPLRSGEPWYGEAVAAFERAMTGAATDADWSVLDRLVYGRWDAAAQAHAALVAELFDEEAAQAYLSPGAFDDAEAVRATLSELDVPVLVLAGELDPSPRPSAAAQVAGIFPRGELVVQPGSGHNPWIDGPEEFVRTVEGFLARRP
ncbi:alpha/beta fold hydrolase [Streptacidiphilus fuscans]|uniref:Alpha/beta hydrolase n=1 Tax=Streptacidiphilus fuscans TaxID=2789292 RepID=A0A931FH00_9ACTN|nr:alpha/beta hydrolase [Streptacidiphilus fuscans]MBF9071376.1 alpha/beta hydrolase [Streptacidiphilus fuscans]